MAFTISRGAKIHYEVVGRGVPVVLLHGLFSDGREWVRRGMVEKLGADCSYITIDAIGHGESDRPHTRQRYELEARVEDVVSVLDALGVKTAHAVGYSMGGWTVCGLARYAPRRFRSLVVGGWDPDGGIRSFLESALERSGVPMTFERLVPIVSVDRELAANIQAGDDEAFRCAYAVLSDFTNAEDDLTAASVPVLFYCGELDPYHEPTRAASARIPKSSFVSIPNSDHVAVSQRVDLVAPVVKAFLTNCIEDDGPGSSQSGGGC